ncbi:MAG: LysR substrate-binding domain-containing protein [Burkholderiaceae bacterium]
MSSTDEGRASDAQPTDRFFRDTLKLRHLRMLAALSELGQVSRVARAFNVTQPAISKQLAEIERALEAKVVVREGNRLRFTAVGERLAAHARRVVQQLERARFDVDALRRGIGGRVSIGAVTSVAPTLLPEAIRLLMAAAPAAVVSVTEGHFVQLLPQLESGALDMLVARAWQPFSKPGIEQASLYREPVLVVVGAKHPLGSRADVVWADALQWPWIAPAPGSLAREAIDAFLARSGLALPGGNVESTSLPLAIELMRVAPYVGLMGHRLAHHHARRGDLIILPLALDEVLSEARCYWRSGAGDAIQSLFRECLQQAARQAGFDSDPG